MLIWNSISECLKTVTKLTSRQGDTYICSSNSNTQCTSVTLPWQYCWKCYNYYDYINNLSTETSTDCYMPQMLRLSALGTVTKLTF